MSSQTSFRDTRFAQPKRWVGRAWRTETCLRRAQSLDSMPSSRSTVGSSSNRTSQPCLCPSSSSIHAAIVSRPCNPSPARSWKLWAAWSRGQLFAWAHDSRVQRTVRLRRPAADAPSRCGGGTLTLGLRYPTVRIVDHDSRWSSAFSEEHAILTAALGSVGCGIEHMGSTAVPGLPAKPNGYSTNLGKTHGSAATGMSRWPVREDRCVIACRTTRGWEPMAIAARRDAVHREVGPAASGPFRTGFPLGS